MTSEQLQKQIKLSDKLRNFKWVKHQYDKGRLYLGSEKLTKPLFEQFRQAIKATEDIYSGAWDLDIVVNFVMQKGKVKIIIEVRKIVIYFPEIKITNSRKREHNIVDLFVACNLSVYNKQLYLADLQGGRMKLSFAEFTSSYLHSHLPAQQINAERNPPYYNHFCTGSGHINEAIAEINSDGFSIEKFTTYLLNLYTLVSWESIEGTPHISMSSISARVSNAREYYPSDTNFQSLYKTLIRDYIGKETVPVLNFTLENNKFKLKEDEDFEKFLFSKDFTETEKLRYLCTLSNNGRYYLYGSDPQYSSVPTFTREYIFQGISKPLEVYGAPGKDKEEIKYIIHPQIKDKIKKEIEYECNKKAIRKSTVDRYTSEISDIGEDTKSDKILVPADSKS